MENPKCAVEGCAKPKRSRGLCSTHYERWRLKGDAGANVPIRPYGHKGEECAIDGCNRGRKAKGLCKAHYDRARAGLPLDVAIRAKAPAGYSTEKAFSYWASGEPTEDGCIEWTGSVLPSGYGSLSISGNAKLAHRVAWEIANGSAVPTGLVVRHSCDNRLCVNIRHLSLGTYGDNSADMTSRNRQALGERVPTAKMTERSVRELRRLRESGLTYTQLAERFGISRTQVSNIVHRVSWKHL